MPIERYWHCVWETGEDNSII